ncbi:MAG TPA: M56 family metallopeptidase [Gemmatimonadaceae bacterium]|nr:M56 family metallopeptidase [Gemmatimonadaceae bacterium]
MIAAWMLEASIVGLLFAVGAAAAQRVLTLYRPAPLRWLWAGALAATMVVSAAWLVPARAPALPAGVAAAPVATAGAASPLRVPVFRLPPVPLALERALVAAWAVISLSLAAMLLFAMARLRRERRGWNDGIVGGAPVWLSDSLGPAAVGVWRPRVVLPPWVLALDDAAQRAIVAHEAEHQRMHDPALLAGGLVAVVLMPWNAGVWLAWRGLRNAVEFDCDERVLRRGVERAAYARILLGAWEHTRVRWLPSAALTRPSGLGSRVEHLMRPEPRRRGMKALIGTMAAALLVIAACETPAPQRVLGTSAPQPSKSVAQATVVRDPLIIIDGVKQDSTTGHVVTPANGASRYVRVPDAGAPGTLAALAKISAADIASVDVLKGDAATAKYGADGVNGVIIITTKKGAASKGGSDK